MRIAPLSAAMLFCAAAAVAQAPQSVAPVATSPTPTFSVGDKAPALTFQDASDASVTLDPTKAPATVVIFVSNRCPVSNAYNERMRALADAYSSKSVQFAFVDANVNESATELAELKTKAGFPFAVYRDANNTVADQLAAQVTPEVFVFDNTGTLKYRGAVDDSRNPANVQHQNAREALDAVLAGKPVEVATTKAFGCSIKRHKAA